MGGIVIAVGSSLFFDLFAVLMLALSHDWVSVLVLICLAAAVNFGILCYYAFGWLPSIFSHYGDCCRRAGRVCTRVWCCRLHFNEDDARDREELIEVDPIDDKAM